MAVSAVWFGVSNAAKESSSAIVRGGTSGSNPALRNKSLSIEEINYAVQKIIDRIIFLRMCEDRGIELYGNLKKAMELIKK